MLCNLYLRQNGAVGRPTPAPNNIIGTSEYYRWRYNDFNERYQNTNVSPPDYYLDYGDKYIRRFSNQTYYQLSEPGKIWLRKALVNLQTAIEVELNNDPTIELSQNRFSKFAFGSHVGAYVHAGFLQLSVLDKVRIALTPDAKDLFSAEGIQQAIEIGKMQAGYYASNPMFAISQGIELYMERNIIKQLIIDYSIKNAINPFTVTKLVGNYFAY